MNVPDDSSTDLEARLRAWRPAALPPALHARLLAAQPLPRRSMRLDLRAGVALALAGSVLWWWRSEPPTPAGARAAWRAPQPGRFVEAAWTPGASLTMNLATGVSADNPPAPWRLDTDADVAGGLLTVRCADGKLPFKVDCQF